jgi:hypothetical protein
MAAKVTIIVVACCALLTGCSQEDNKRLNDSGPPIQMNPDGPGPMQPPSREGRSTLR